MASIFGLANLWVLWVTDQPNGGGNTLLTLTFSSRLAG